MAMFDWFRKATSPTDAKNINIMDLDAALRAYGATTLSGASVSPETAMRVVAVYACVDVLSRSVAQTPMLLYRVQKDGSRVRIGDHKVATLMSRRPNGWQTPYEFKSMMQAHLCLRGNAYAYKIDIGGKLSLQPLHPDSVDVIQEDDTTLVYRVKLKSGGEAVLRSDQVLHLRGLSMDGIKGVSRIQYAREAVGLALTTEQHGARLFANGAQIGGVLEHPGKLSDEAAKRLRQNFDERYSGVNNSHKTLLLEEGMKFDKVGMTAEDAQFLESRKYQRGEIASLFGVPPHMIGDLEKATFSNIEHQGLEFVRNTLSPWFTCWGQAFERDLLTENESKDFEISFDPRILTQGDFKSRMDGYSIGIQSGVLSPNDARRLEGENPRDGGDVYLTPLNMAPNGSDSNADKK